MADTQDVGQVMTLDEFNALYSTPSVDKSTFWKQDKATGNILSIPMQETAIYNGGFVSQYLNRTGQAVVGIFSHMPGAAIAQAGAQIKEKGITGSVIEKGLFFANQVMPGLAQTLHAIDAESALDRYIGETLDGSYEAYQARTELFGEKLTNFGLHMAERGKEIVEEMNRYNPVDNPIAGFLGDATGSILSTLGLMAIGGEALTLGVFGLSSGLDVSTQALEAGHDANTSLAAGILVGASVTALEKIGLDAIFSRTARTGVQAALAHIVGALTAEGITEGLQEVVEIGGSYAVGGQARQLSIADALAQITYAGAVGAFSGGVMVGGVTVAQRAKAVNIMQQAMGVDRATANTVVQGAEQAAMDDIFSKVGEDTGYDAIQNKKYQNMRDIIALARGEAGVSNEAMQQLLDSLEMKSPGEQFLAEIRAQVTADVNAEIEEGTLTGKTAKGTKEVKKAATTIEQLEQTAVKTPELFTPIEPEVINNVEPIYRQAFIGRVRQLSLEAKQIKKDLMINLRQQAKQGLPPTTKTIQNLMRQYIDTTSEIAYLKENPGDIVFTGDNKVVLQNAEVLGKIADRQTALILRNVKNNFKRGQKASKLEMEYVKAAIKELLNRPGISQSQKYEQLGKLLNRIKTPEQFQKQFLELEGAVDDIIKNNLIGVYKQSVQNIVEFFKGKGSGTKRRVNLSPKAQTLADTFLKAFKTEDIDPTTEVVESYTPEGYMRTLAARLATETNPDGSPLTVRDYMNIDDTLRKFIAQGSLAFVKQREIDKNTTERIRTQVIEELQQTERVPTTPAQEFWEKTMSRVSRIFNYDALIGSLAKGMAGLTGSTAFETVMDVDKPFMRYEALKSYFSSKFHSEVQRIYGLKSMLDVSKKFLHDNVNDTDVIVSTEDEAGNINQIWNGTLAQAREKYLVWLSPEGQEIMQNQGWDESAIENLIEYFSEQDLAFINMQLELYNEMYTMVNDTFKKAQGYDLNYRERYSPIYRADLDFETTNMIDQLLGRGPQYQTMQDPRFTKALSRSEKTLKDVADFQKLTYYINDATYYSAMDEKLSQIKSILGNHEVRNQIEKTRDKDFLQRLNRFVDTMARGRRYAEGTSLDSSMNKFVTNTQKMLLAAKAVLFPKQLVSSLAALDVVSVGNYVKYLADLPKALKDGRLSELLEHYYFAHRSMSRAISRDLADINRAFEMEQWSAKSVKKAEFDLTLNHYLFLATQLGDMGGVILNGWAVYNHYIDQGMGKAEAANMAVNHIVRTQQSARVTQQMGMALDPHPITRAFTSFTHALMQYASILVQQLDTLGTERFNAKKFARTFAVFFTVLPMLYAAIGRAFDYRKEDIPQYIAEFALGPFDNVPIAGGLLRVLVARLTYAAYKAKIDEEVNMPRSANWDQAASGLFESMFKNIADVERALTKEYDEGFMLSDFLNITTQLAEATGPLGGIYSGAARSISNAAQGIVLMSEENGNGTTINSARRALMLLGYSEYATRPKEEE